MIAGVHLGTRLVTICELVEHGAASLRNPRVPGSLDSLQGARALAVLATRVEWPGVVWVERPYGAHIRSVADLSRVYGAILAAIPTDRAVSEISAPESKKAIGLAGNAEKTSVIAWAKEEYGLGPRRAPSGRARYRHRLQALQRARRLHDRRTRGMSRGTSPLDGGIIPFIHWGRGRCGTPLGRPRREPRPSPLHVTPGSLLRPLTRRGEPVNQRLALMDVTLDPHILTKSWRVRLRTKTSPSPDQLAELERWLRALERAGRLAFNIYPSRYEDPAAPEVREAVDRLRGLGATSGIAYESINPCIRLRIDPEPAP